MLKADRSLLDDSHGGTEPKPKNGGYYATSLGPLPWALSTSDGLPGKTNKAA